MFQHNKPPHFAIPQAEDSQTILPKLDQGDGLPDIQRNTIESGIYNWLSLAARLVVILPFVMLLIAAIALNGKPINEAHWEMVQVAIKVAVTLFPLCFAMIVGQLLQKIAQFKLERGAIVGTLQQLVGSTTVFGTLSTLFSFRSLNRLGIGLFFLWALSPLGAQGTLRILSASYKYTVSSPHLAYLNVVATSSLVNKTLWNYQNSAADDLFIAGLVTYKVTGQSSTDLWGNVKIPILNDTMSAGSWIDTTDRSVPYSSTIGIPLFGLLENGNTSGTITTSYISFECADLVQVSYQSTLFNRSAYYPPSMTYLNGTSQEAAILWIDAIYQEGWTTGNYSAATCSATLVPVEASISCIRSLGMASTRGECSVTSIRVNNGNISTKDLPDIFSDEDSFNNFSSSIQKTMPLVHPATPSIMDGFMNDPYTLGNMMDMNISLFQMDPILFSQRLTQLINSFYMARLEYQFLTMISVPGMDINNTDNFTVTYGSSSAVFNISTGRGSHKETFMTCSIQGVWFFFFLLATLVLIASCIATFVIASKILTPDILGYVSSLTRDKPQFKSFKIPSTLNGWKRAQLLGDVFIRFGDVDPHSSDIGTLDIGLKSSTRRSRSHREFL
ncbi:hypothetical protein BGW36DRAFT_457502 [Talaromyces proteolyticus]|uniref:Uncharacterized protein n=1 Tax=Talaromyces proteolyticus TaxID=1131652 RepID=A0AAD4L418_9EURO|nr:uncharacterized protein BGW36DRAFT_457502 [Talaromyces proteolyticus]KAH8703167.1 hypothetical protein BGW36DRAFT_457502 [Talaromyces proteolyticus]